MQALNLGCKLWVPGCLTRTDTLVPPIPQQLRGGAPKLLPQPFHPITLYGFFFLTASFLIGSCAADVRVLHLCAVEWKVLPHEPGSIWGIVVLLFGCLSHV